MLEKINTNNINCQVDIQTIVQNAKNDKRFFKLLNLCIKYKIHIFDQQSDSHTLLNNNNLVDQSNEKLKELSKDLSKKINELSDVSNNLYIDIDNVYNQYKKKCKDIELIIYILKNIFDDTSLKNLCCIYQNITSSYTNSIKKNSEISESQDKSVIDENGEKNLEPKNSELAKKQKSDKVDKDDKCSKRSKNKLSKYIAIYSN
jgi:hypothetical protein